MTFREWLQTFTHRHWYHATSQQTAQQIMAMKRPTIVPGMPSHYRIDIPRHDAVYVTSDLSTARGYSLEREKGTILEVSIDQSKLIPDEDAVWELLSHGRDALARRVKQIWFQNHNLIRTQEGQKPYGAFSSAWRSYSKAIQGWDVEMTSGLSTDMKMLVDEIVAQDKQLAQSIIEKSELAAHLGPVLVVGEVKR